MLDKKNIILFSSISGVDIEGCARQLCEVKDVKQHKPIKVEDFLISEAAELLERITPKRPGGYNIVDVVGLPLPELANVCERAWANMLNQALAQPHSANFVIATFHPVLFLQKTHEFAEPYLAGKIQELTSQWKQRDQISISWIVSIHDDIYDIYRRLMRRGQLFAQRRENRNALRDIADLRMLLEWRDRELSATRALAASLGAQHLLFHRKGRLKSLSQIVLEGKPCVYFSHSISQPRRDINEKVEEGKSRQPNFKRGEELIRAIQAFANHLAVVAPIVEPTAIDEYRINSDRLDDLAETDLCCAILPPLTRRWPIGEGTRLGGDPAELNKENDLELLPLSDGESATLNGSKATGEKLSTLKKALDLLILEIERQINVRDHILAAQAEMVVAFRPFSRPNSPDPTGGVKEELETIRRKAKLRNSKICKPYAIIIHPRIDELRRRANQFDKAWDAEVGKYFSTNDELLQVKAKCRELISSTESPDSKQELERIIARVFEQISPSLHAVALKSSMQQAGMMQTQESRDLFISAVCSENSSILKSPLQNEAEKSDDWIVFINEPEFTAELAELIRNSFKEFKFAPATLDVGLVSKDSE